MNEPQFQGHFPERPLMPGVLIVEAMAQVGGLIVTQMPDLPKGLFVFAGIDGVRFRRPVVPGDQLVIRCELLSLKRKRFGKVKAEATVDGDLACSGELMFSLVDSAGCRSKRRHNRSTPRRWWTQKPSWLLGS